MQVFMKKIILALGLLVLVITGCAKQLQPIKQSTDSVDTSTSLPNTICDEEFGCQEKVTIIGTLLSDNKEGCNTVISIDNKLYPFEGDLKNFKKGDKVKIEGYYVEADNCNTGEEATVGITTIQSVESSEILSKEELWKSWPDLKGSFCGRAALLSTDEADRPRDKTGLWIYVEHFNGMNHGPDISHICRGEKEAVLLEMNWGEPGKVRTGTLRALDSESKFIISSTNTDPKVTLVKPELANRIIILVEGRKIIFDEKNKEFTKGN